ncbi:hypothetical protein D3C85_1083240 [compost metagenome]
MVGVQAHPARHDGAARQDAEVVAADAHVLNRQTDARQVGDGFVAQAERDLP